MEWNSLTFKSKQTCHKLLIKSPVILVHLRVVPLKNKPHSLPMFFKKEHFSLLWQVQFSACCCLLSLPPPQPTMGSSPHSFWGTPEGWFIDQPQSYWLRFIYLSAVRLIIFAHICGGTSTLERRWRCPVKVAMWVKWVTKWTFEREQSEGACPLSMDARSMIAWHVTSTIDAWSHTIHVCIMYLMSTIFFTLCIDLSSVWHKDVKVWEVAVKSGR